MAHRYVTISGAYRMSAEIIVIAIRLWCEFPYETLQM